MQIVHVFLSLLLLASLTACAAPQANSTDNKEQLIEAFRELAPAYHRDGAFTVLHKAEYREKSYAAIASAPDLETPCIYLVEYSNAEGGILISKYASGDYSLSAGIAANCALMSDVGVFWSEVTAQRLGKDPDTGGYDILIENPDKELQFRFADGEVFSQPIEAPIFCMVFFEKERLPAQVYIVEDWVDCIFFPA